MANERRLIDADALEGEAICLYTYGGARYIPLAALKRSPTVDAVEVVFCKDCKHWDRMNTSDEGGCYWDPLAEGVDWTRANDYCSRGERKSGTQPQREDV